jgi:uncharacterized damage-inducible protein DinB
MDNSLPTIYNWVTRTREDVLTYTESLPNEIYLQHHPEVPYGSIRDLHAHIAYAYLWWVGRYGLGLPAFAQELETKAITTAVAMRKKFLEVDAILEQALTTFEDLDAPFEVIRPGRDQLMVTKRWLIVRPITHEFHHQGQLLLLGRLLGHPMPEGLGADLVLPDFM